MKFHTFGQPSSPVMLLIHGTLTPWQIWGTQIAHFCREYYVVAVALDAHTEEERSDFVSIEQEAAAIEAWLGAQQMHEIYAVCGISLGGAVAHQLWQDQKLRIRHLVLDSAPLLKFGRLPEWCMTRSYLRIIAGSRRRDPKVLADFERDFLPGQYLESYLKIADRITVDSVRNMLASVCRYTFAKGITSDTRILYLHGTKGSEWFMRRTASRMQKHYPAMEVRCLTGCGHCEYAIYQPEKWLDIVENWMQQKPRP